MSDPVIDLRIIASTSGAEAGLARVGKTAETELGAGGKLGKAGKEAENSLGGVGKTAGKAGKDVEKSAKGATGALKDVEKGSNGLLQSFTGISLGQGAVVAGFALVGLAAKGVLEEYNKNKEANLILNQAMLDSGQKITPQWTRSLEDAQKAAENLGFQQSDTTQELANLTLAGLTQKQALGELSNIQDLARAKNLSLADASEVVIKGINGQTRGLKDYNIVGLEVLPTTAAVAAGNVKLAADLKKSQDATAAFNEVQNKSGVMTTKSLLLIEKARMAQEKYTTAVKDHGKGSLQAQAAEMSLQSADSALQSSHDKGAATYAKAQAKMDAANATYKAQLEKMNTTSSIAAVRAHNLTIMHDALAKKVGGQAQAATHSLGVEWQIVSAKFNDFAGNAIPKVEAGIASVLQVLGTGIAWIVTNVFPVIGEIATVITADIKAVAPYFEVAFKVIVTIVSTYIKIIVGIFKVEFAIISGIITGVIAVIKGIAGVVSGVFGVVGNVIAGVLAAPKAIIDGIITAINAVIGVIDAIQVHIHFGPVNMDWNGLRIPKIPMLYQGGVALGSAGGSLAVVGDKNQDEAIIPLPKNWRTGGSTPGTDSGGGRGKSVTIQQYITTQATPDAINRAVLRGLRTSGVTAI